MTFTSLSTLTCLFRCFSNSPARSASFGHGKLAQNFTILAFTIGPGTPIPIPFTSTSKFILLPFTCSNKILDSLSTVFSNPSIESVFTIVVKIIFPASSTSPILVFVPPKSIPT